MASSFLCLFSWLLVCFLPPHVSSEPRPSHPRASFTLPQDHIDDTAEKRQGEGHPGQDVGEAVGVVRGGMPLRVPDRVDGRRTHHTQTWEGGGPVRSGRGHGAGTLRHPQPRLPKTPGTSPTHSALPPDSSSPHTCTHTCTHTHTHQGTPLSFLGRRM